MRSANAGTTQFAVASSVVFRFHLVWGLLLHHSCSEFRSPLADSDLNVFGMLAQVHPAGQKILQYSC